MPIKLFKSIKVFSSGRNARAAKHSALVGSYFFTSKDLKEDQPLFNDGYLSLIFMPNEGDIAEIEKAGEPLRLGAAWVCAGILENTHWKIPEALDHIVVLRFRPHVFASLFGTDLSKFRSDPVFSFEDIAVGKWQAFIREYYQIADVQERIKFLEKTFETPAHQTAYPFVLEKAIDLIESKQGNLTVNDLLTCLGDNINYKWLHRNFVRYLGLSPKKFISLQRFLFAYRDFDHYERGPLKLAAPAHGYYDYNHFLKDFKRYLGKSPSQFLNLDCR